MIYHGVLLGFLENISFETLLSLELSIVEFSAILVALFLLFLLLIRMKRRWQERRLSKKRSRKAIKRSRRASKGETDAEKLLEKKGFKILERQNSIDAKMFIDGKETIFTVRVDIIAEAETHKTLPPGTRVIAEVKTGKLAPNPAMTATRRQLREYSHLYKAKVVYLIDMEANKIHEIVFPKSVN